MIEFDNVVSRPAYYLEEPNQLRTEFRGQGSRLLGVEGQFDEATFHRLFRGMQPELVGGKEAKLVQRIGASRRGAFDITLNMPKTSSIMKELAGDTRISDVMDRAQAVVEGMLEKQVRVRVRKQAEIDKSKAKQPKGWKYPERHTGNLVFIAFAHPASRNGDPHAHRHLVVPNITYDRHERMWKAVEFRHLDRKGIAEAYRAELMNGLNQLGYKTKRVGKEFEIVGVPAEVKAEFSRRHTQIKELEREYDDKAAAAGNRAMSSKERGKLSLYHRPEKASGVSPAARRDWWLSRITPPQLDGLRSLVRKAKSAVRDARFKQGVRQHLQAIQKASVIHAEPERNRGNER